MRFVISFLFLAACGCGLLQEADSPEKSLALRRRFARAMDKIEEGMPAERVVELLGPPDDVRTRIDPGGLLSRMKEVWRYGTSGHLTAATLGEVYIDREGKVDGVCGKGNPPRNGLFEEEELRALLTVLDACPSLVGRSFNPRPLIRAVNLLHPLGKERALTAIAEYLRACFAWDFQARQRMFLVLRALFDVPQDPGYMPRMRAGEPTLCEPEDPTLIPRFPLAIEGDIPFLLMDRGYSLVGVPYPPEEHLVYFREHGTLRGRPLVPTDRPLEAVQELLRRPWGLKGLQKDSWGIPMDDGPSHHMAMNQILLLLSAVYRSEPGFFGDLFPRDPEDEAQRRRILDEVGALQIRWDFATSRYVFLDGSVLPDPEPKIYRREYWNPWAQGLQMEITIERRDSRWVDIELTESWRPETFGVAGELQLFEEGPAGRLINEIKVGERRHSDLGRAYSGDRIDLDEGTSLRPRLVLSGQEECGPVFTP